MIKYIY